MQVFKPNQNQCSLSAGINVRLIPKYTANNINRFSYPFFQEQFSGALADKIKDLCKGTAEIIRIVIESFFSNIVALLAACVTLYTINFILPLVLLLWAFSLVAISLKSTKKIRDYSYNFSEKGSFVLGNIVDCFSNILSVKLFSMLNRERDNLKSHLNEYVNAEKEMRWYLLKVLSLQFIITIAMISFTVGFLAYSFNIKQFSVGDCGLVLTLVLSFIDVIWRLTEEIIKFSETCGLVNQGVRLLNSFEDSRKPSHQKDILVTKGEIIFDDVTFHYADRKPLFIKKTLTIQHGKKVGIVGLSGSGKSTFTNLILRLFDIHTGKIIIDDQDISNVSLESLHRSITLVSQDTSLFHRRIIDNICYGRTDCTEEEVITAAKKASAHDFIIQLPLGYNTIVGERGLKLSGGQKQRIIIARAILKNAPILIFDEAMSALDSLTENLVRNILHVIMKGKTSLVISHRISTLIEMDRILVFDQGKVVGDGTHQELLNESKHYQVLWNAQIKNSCII